MCPQDTDAPTFLFVKWPILSGWGHNSVGLDEWKNGEAHLHTLSN